MFRNDKIKIGDFGLATEDSQDAEDPMERTVGKGTKLYMAPEQVGRPSLKLPRHLSVYSCSKVSSNMFTLIPISKECKKVYDRKVDIFAVGLIYFELLWKVYTRMERNEVSVMGI